MNVLRAFCFVAAFATALCGCKTGPRASRAAAPADPHLATRATPAVPFARSSHGAPPQGVVLASAIEFQEALPLPSHADADQHPRAVPQITVDMLSREWLEAEVVSRNPSLEAMVAAAQAADQLYPQKIALDDPMLMGMIAPQSAASNLTETAYAFQLNQKLPWLGKRRLRGAAAAADADAAAQDAEDTRLRVRLTADMAFFEYFLAAQLIELNRENTAIMTSFREAAQSKYRNNQVTQQDLLQGDLELADLQRKHLELDRMQRVAIARINTLLRQWPDTPLPPPPAQLDSPQAPVDANLLWQTALAQRPDLAALAWRVQSEEAALELAYKNYHPDFDLFTRYDTFWQPASTQGPLRAQVGVAMNLPVYREKLHAAVCEAQFRLKQRRAEFEQRSLDIQYEVISAAQQVEESRQAVDLYARSLVPTAERNVAAARANYEVNRANFIDLAQSQRQLVLMRERQLEAIVAYQRRIAELDRAVGGPALVRQPEPLY